MKQGSFYIFFLIPFLIWSQQSKIDSLTTLFNESKADTTKARLLSEIGVITYTTNPKQGRVLNDSLISLTEGMINKYRIQGFRMKGTYFLLDRDYQNSEKNYLKALDMARSISNRKLIGNLYGSLGTLYGWQNKLDSAIQYYEKAVRLNDSLNLKEQNIRPYINLAITVSQQNKLEKANDYLFKALEIAENNNSDQLGYLYNEIAINYLRLDVYDKAEAFLKKALPIAEKKEDNFALARIHNSLGYLSETRDEDWQKTLFHYEKSLKYYQVMQHSTGIIDAYGNAGIQHMRLGNYPKSKEYFTNALQLASEKNSIDKMIIGNLNLSELYIKQKNKTESKKYLNKGLALIGKGSKLPYKNHFYRIGNLFAENKSYKIAYDNVKDYAILADSLFKENSVNKIAEVEAKYQTEKKEKENLLLRNEKAEQELKITKENRLKWFFGIGLLASLISLGIFYYFYQKNKKQKNIIENLQKELHHRVKNNLSVIDTFIEVAKDEFDEEQFSNKLTELQNRIDSINEVHSQLYKSDDVTNLDLKKYIEFLSKNVQSSFSSSDIVIEKKISDTLSINPSKSFSIGLIINEFLTNSFKYAFDNNIGKVEIDLKEIDSKILLKLSDNGKGFPGDIDIQKTESFGLRIMKLLSEQLDGTFDLKGDNGVQLKVEFPK